VSYGTTPAGQAAKFVPDVLLSAAGSVPVNASTNASGAYSLSGLGSGPYTVTPSKSGGVNGVSGLDAARVAQHVAGLIVLSPNQQLAGDATNNGSLSGLDAARIAQTTAGIPNSGIVGQWKFLPAARNYTNVPNSVTGENYEAILVGDVTGNWTASAARGAVEEPEPVFYESRQSSFIDGLTWNRTLTWASDVLNLDLPATAATATGAVVGVPVSIGDTTGKGIVAYEFTLHFDPSLLRPELNAANSRGTLSDGWSFTVNSETAGQLTVTAYGTQELNGAGTLLNLNFTRVRASNARTPLTWTRFKINEDEISSELVRVRN
jgi:hypothetical protein